ncbi:IS982 family transposase [Nibrella saemangeumensis]|uniref:IS982 family transposase n=1 Tax=Nibrella saemangeumensis TaxID=1084526 RepID=A0ABP8MVQ5_9BACT
MLCEDKALKLIEIFITCDDFCQALTQWQTQQGTCPPIRAGQLTDSQMLAITIFYHHSGAKCFEYYYRHWVQAQLTDYFPRLISYERFVARMPRLLPGLFVLLKWLCAQSQRTGFYIIDSKPLAVCDNHRIASNKVFAGLAVRGKSTMGWFYGFKVHLVINQYGQLINFMLTAGNVADNSPAVLTQMLANLQGQCFGDRGYLTRLFAEFYQRGLHIITKLRRKMKPMLMPLADKLKLRRRGLIESVNDLLTSVFDVEHTRHRSVFNSQINVLAGLIAYCFYDHKPSIVVPAQKHLHP